MKTVGGFLLFFVPALLRAQQTLYTPDENTTLLPAFRTAATVPLAKLYQRNHGAIIGLQGGQYTFIELGYEAHWRKMSLLKKPHIIGATANLEYNFGHHVLGYKAGAWMKRGRVNLTYGANLVYFTDFNGGSRYGLNPVIGFRLVGFHLLNGYNFLAGDKEFDKVNTVYVGLRYYFPVDNKFTWDRREKKRREKARQKRREERRKKGPWWNPFRKKES